MITRKQIYKYCKREWRQCRGVVTASALGFLFGIALAQSGRNLQGYLLVRMMEWREATLETTQRLVPMEEHSGFVRAPIVLLPEIMEPVRQEPAPIIDRSTVPEVRQVPIAPPKKPKPFPPKIKPAAPAPVILPTPTPHPISNPAKIKDTIHSSLIPVPSPVPISASPLRASVTDFPAFGNAIYPVSKVPNWGGMHRAAEWNRSYDEMTELDFVDVPAYDMQKLMTPYKNVVNPRNDAEITRKLFYSTHYFGKYDLDAGEFTGAHPGIDLKLSLGTPIGSIAGGRVHRVVNQGPLGLHVIIEHRIGSAVYYSIYGHMGYAAVKDGDDVKPGQFIGTVGMTGSTTGAHVHLQVDIGHPSSGSEQTGYIHEPYSPKIIPSPAEAAKWVVNPITFISEY